MNHLLAQVTIPGSKTPLPNPAGFRFTGAEANLGSVVTVATQIIFAIAGFGLLLMLILGGFDFLTSAGDAKKLEQGKQRLTYAIVGFLIIFAAFWIVQIFGKVFGLNDVIGGVFQ